MDQNELLRRLAAQAGGDAALERLSGALGTADGRRAVEQLSAQHADELEQAAKAAQRGDMRSAAQAAQKLMQTPEVRGLPLSCGTFSANKEAFAWKTICFPRC
ncbi:hypothetical protein DXA92_02070 [Agathobaculum butyriciproducens]|nr:hypothetical protein DXA94_02095 [Agathobaculum butyriciproducens]RGC63314.1 hypothetical protein DXA92_02070 [Agathobaculum butyriciproducens]